ncbi:hypothetical protein LCGC14_2511450 [marine sediment metagenome]|uniref:Uncharacterized protein n=1 Tax=marine sediment metagenome TaxID=412755 RepID=A0A0F9DAS5_9ZZZZ
MVKQIPRNAGFPHSGSGEMGQATLVDYLDAHAEEWRPPIGEVHLHLMVKRRVYWQVVERGSSICSVPGRCHRALLSIYEGA